LEQWRFYPPDSENEIGYWGRAWFPVPEVTVGAIIQKFKNSYLWQFGLEHESEPPIRGRDMTLLLAQRHCERQAEAMIAACLEEDSDAD